MKNFLKKKNLQSGFTLIELLVVIAIIAILSAIILVSLNSARAKAKDAKVQSELSDLRAQMELYYDSNGQSYGQATGCGQGNTGDPFNSSDTDAATALISGINGDINGSSGSYQNMDCNAQGQVWVADAKLNSGQYWCVDSNGASKTESGPIAQSDTNCQ